MPLVYLQQDSEDDNRFLVQVAGGGLLGYLIQRDNGEVEAQLSEELPFADRVFASLDEAVEEIQAEIGDE